MFIPLSIRSATILWTFEDVEENLNEPVSVRIPVYIHSEISLSIKEESKSINRSYISSAVAEASTSGREVHNPGKLQPV